MANSNGKISMKLLIDSKNNKVLFAEAGKECVDFFLHLLALPIGTVVRCLTKEAMVGSLGNLYDSLENLSNDYLLANLNKDCLLNPKPAIGSSPGVPLLTMNEVPNSYAKTHYLCSGCYNYLSEVKGAYCSCNTRMTRTVTYVRPLAAVTSQAESCGGAGYVKGVVTYMIMDDLGLSPMSSISSITLLNKFNVKDVGCLREKVVSLDMNQGIALLKASLMSKAVLTDVFLGKTRI